MAALFATSMFHTAYTAVHDGHITVNYSRGGNNSHLILRSQQPKLFWSNVALITHLGMLITAFGVWALTDAIKQKRARPKP